MSKTLIACFSATGVTEEIAKMIARLTRGESFAIKPAKPYTEADLNWNDKNSRTTIEQNDKSCRPAIADKVNNMGEYKTIFLGFPIWWYGTPKIILTFLESYDFSGKVIIPFVTSGSSGLGNIPRQLEEACPAAHWQKGRRFAAGASEKEVAAWVNEYTGWQN